nr:unnamed protein product [Digitaria exilis]
MDKYEEVRDIGSGNFGVARLMRNRETRGLVAVKLIERGHRVWALLSLLVSASIDENVYREIINHRSLRHPNIIQFIEDSWGNIEVLVILTPRHLAIVMEYAAGGELFDRIVDRGRFSEDEARYFFQQLICGVSYCHHMQICHRDLKLENVLLDGSPAPRLKICDFGYSKSSVLHSRPKSAVGTPAYIAPEVLSRREYDGKRIAAIQYKIPDNIHISDDCRELISRIFVSNPSRRITMREIKIHPWFLKNLPRELTESVQLSYFRRDNSVPAFSNQTTEEIMKIVKEARTMPKSSRLGYGYIDEFSDEEEKEEETEPKVEEEDECDKRVREVRESGELDMASLHI